jgi:hypothetical protein
MFAVDMTEVLFSTTATLLGFCFLYNVRTSTFVNFFRCLIRCKFTFMWKVHCAAVFTGLAVMLFHAFLVFMFCMFCAVMFMGVVSMMSVVSMMGMVLVVAVPVVCLMTFHRSTP